jgi:hypothetical protein
MALALGTSMHVPAVAATAQNYTFVLAYVAAM